MGETSYKKLVVWQKSMKLALLLYKKTKTFPKEELFGLVSQMRRAAVSIPENIAEGYMSKGLKEYKLFISYSQGSCSELETYLILSHRLLYLSQSDFEELSSLHSEVSKMFFALHKNAKH